MRIHDVWKAIHEHFQITLPPLPPNMESADADLTQILHPSMEIGGKSYIVTFIEYSFTLHVRNGEATGFSLSGMPEDVKAELTKVLTEIIFGVSTE
jgi:hypothetical protein